MLKPVLVALSLLGPLAAQSEPYVFRAGEVLADPADRPRVKPLGDLQFEGGAKLPAYLVSVQDGLAEGGWSAPAPPPMTLPRRLDPKLAGRLAAYRHAGVWILVPRGWQAVRGGSGADGSTVLAFAPSSGLGHVTYTSMGACVGCAQSAASLFFPEARRSAEENGFPFCDRANVPVKAVRIRPKIMAYRAVVQGQPIDGLADYDGDRDLPFHKIEASLPAADRDLATPILNGFLPPR